MQSGYGLTKVGNQLKLDFGANGLGGSRTSAAGDGFYRVLLDIDADGVFGEAEDQAFEFHRLLGDADGNGLVNVGSDGVFNTLDTNVVDSVMGQIGGNSNGDLDGSGIVNSTDRSFTTRQRGRKLTDVMRGLLDD